jgi:hypothetical protein
MLRPRNSVGQPKGPICRDFQQHLRSDTPKTCDAVTQCDIAGIVFERMQRQKLTNLPVTTADEAIEAPSCGLG